jgi:hypothetical protein
VKQSKFDTAHQKAQYVTALMSTVNSATSLADKEFAIGFRMKEAYVEYVVASEGLLQLTDITKDDVGF